MSRINSFSSHANLFCSFTYQINDLQMCIAYTEPDVAGKLSAARRACLNLGNRKIVIKEGSEQAASLQLEGLEWEIPFASLCFPTLAAGLSHKVKERVRKDYLM